MSRSMIEGAVSIRRLPASTVTLVQIHGQQFAALASSPSWIRCAQEPGTEIGWACAIGLGEWLIFGESAAIVEARHHRAGDDALHRISDVSAGFAVFRLEGPQVRQLLCTDVGAPQSVRDARPGDRVRMRLAQITVILRCVAADVFELHVDRSLSTYVDGWLNDHAKPLRNHRVPNPPDVP
jgi:heterotetrameric sarcosine oxidase gamma subunit